jgi:surface protein
MFNAAATFNADIGRWNVASVASMASMFTSAKSFNQNLAGWNVRSVTAMGGASPPTVPVRPSCSRMGGSVSSVASLPPRRHLSASFAAPPTVSLQP